MKRALWTALAGALSLAGHAHAQGSPNWPQDYLPGPGEVNGAFAVKQDLITGATPLSGLLVNPQPGGDAVPFTVGNGCVGTAANSSHSVAEIWTDLLGSTGNTSGNGMCIAMQVPPGTNVTQVNGIGVYMLDDMPVTASAQPGYPAPGAVVGLSSNLMARVPNAQTWGLASIQSDSLAAPGATGIIEQNELDFNVTKITTQVTGMVLTGASSVTPNNAEGFVVKQLGSGHAWGNAFHAWPGAATSALLADWAGFNGVGTAPANLSSQYVAFNTTSSAGAGNLVLMRARPNGLVEITGTPGGLSLPAGQLLMGPVSAAANASSEPINFTSVTAGGSPVLIGLQAMNGTQLVVSGSAAQTDFAIAAGNLTIVGGHAVLVGGVPVVGSRRTGWTVNNLDTLSRASFTSSSVSVQQLAQVVQALLVDLSTHGLIGS